MPKILPRHPPAQERIAKFHYVFQMPSSWKGIYGVARSCFELPDPARLEEITIFTYWGERLRYRQGVLLERGQFDAQADMRFVWHHTDEVPTPY